jgi:hypothetical protein
MNMEQGEAERPRAEDGTGRAFVEHFDWVATRGLLNRNTALALRAAASRVLQIEGSDWESVDVRSVDVEELIGRFTNLAKQDFTPQSLATYQSRFRKALSMYIEYLNNPAGYRPHLRGRTSGPPGTQTLAPDRIKPSRATSGGGRASSAKTPASMVRYPFPIRPLVLAELSLPVDLRPEEAERLGAFIASLAVGPADAVHDPEA